MPIPLIYMIIIAAGIGLLPAYIASRKGRSFLVWWIYGALFFIVALPHSLFLSMEQGSKRCGFCGATSKMSAPYCRKCGYEFM